MYIVKIYNKRNIPKGKTEIITLYRRALFINKAMEQGIYLPAKFQVYWTCRSKVMLTKSIKKTLITYENFLFAFLPVF